MTGRDAVIQAGRGAEPDRIIVPVPGMIMPPAAAADQTAGKRISGMGAFSGGCRGSGRLDLLNFLEQFPGNDGRVVKADSVLRTVPVISLHGVADVVGRVCFLEEHISGIAF